MAPTTCQDYRFLIGNTTLFVLCIHLYIYANAQRNADWDCNAVEYVKYLFWFDPYLQIHVESFEESILLGKCE